MKSHVFHPTQFSQQPADKESSILSFRDLPPASVNRWNTRRKAEVLNCICCGIIDIDEACRRYALTLDEMVNWYVLLRKHGLAGLRATRIRYYRDKDQGGDHGSDQCGREPRME